MSAASISNLVTDLDTMPVSDPDLGPDLRSWILRELKELVPPDAPWTDSDPLTVSKYGLADVLACEERFLVPDEFEWSEATLRGRAAHRAIRFLVASPACDAWEAAALAVEELAENDTASVREFIKSMSEPVRGDFINMVATLVDEFAVATEDLDLPVVKPEYGLRLKACRGVVVSGRVDLVLGQPRRQATGPPLRSVAHLELKTGMERHQEYTEDARLYALLDTIKTRVAPGRSAIWYLESGVVLPVSVDAGGLEAAAARLVEGISKMVHLRIGALEPTPRAGWRCNRCPIQTTCPEGQRRALLRREH